MSNQILDEIKESFKKGSVLNKLIYVNLAVFLLVKIVYVIFLIFLPDQSQGISNRDLFSEHFLNYLMVPSDLNTLLIRPWTPITYMFLHFEFLHILFNLVALYLFGRIFLQYLTEKQMLTTYLLGGISGAVLFIIAFNIFPFPNNSAALGASASIMAIIVAISFYSPDFIVYVPFIGQTKIKYIALAFLVIDFLSIFLTNNAGGHIAHIGGFVYGYFFARQLKRGKDLGKGFSRFLDSLFSFFRPRPKLKVSYKSTAKGMTDFDYNKSKAEIQKEIDRILDKIAKSGYDSLSKKEKETLFKMSK